MMTQPHDTICSPRPESHGVIHGESFIYEATTSPNTLFSHTSHMPDTINYGEFPDPAPYFFKLQPNNFIQSHASLTKRATSHQNLSYGITHSSINELRDLDQSEATTHLPISLNYSGSGPKVIFSSEFNLPTRSSNDLNFFEWSSSSSAHPLPDTCVME
jgi:hypothetical protein